MVSSLFQGSEQFHQWERHTHLKVDDDSKHEHGGDEVHEVGEVLPIEGLPQGSDFVRPGCQQVKQSYDRTFKLRTWKARQRTMDTSFKAASTI